MPSKKIKKTQSKASKKKTVNKKPTSKRVASATKVTTKKTTKNNKVSNSASAKKIASKKSEQIIKREAIVGKDLKPKKVLWPIIVLLVILALWFLRDQVIVAMVNGKPISRFQVISELEKQGASQILDSLVTMELVNQAINEAQIEIDEQAVADQMTEIETYYSSLDQNLDDLLATQNITRAEVEQDIRLNLQVDKILADKIQVTEEEIMAYFETNKEFLGEDANFEEMKQDIEAQVIQEKRAEAQQEWLETLRSEANIRYLRFEPSDSL